MECGREILASKCGVEASNAAMDIARQTFKKMAPSCDSAATSVAKTARVNDFIVVPAVLVLAALF